MKKYDVEFCVSTNCTVRVSAESIKEAAKKAQALDINRLGIDFEDDCEVDITYVKEVEGN